MIPAGISLMILLFVISLFTFYGWDYYMKITDKPLEKGKYIRYFVNHYGRYSDNEIRKNDSSIQLPCERNLYSVSKLVFGLQVGNLVYVILTFVLVGLYMSHHNTKLAVSALFFLVVYFVMLFASIVICSVKTKKVEKIGWDKKYNDLIRLGHRNTITMFEAEESVLEGKEVFFNLYGIDFVLDIYQREKDSKKLELLDVTHQRILTVGKNLKEIANAIVINSKSLYSLWEYLNVTIGRSSEPTG